MRQVMSATARGTSAPGVELVALTSSTELPIRRIMHETFVTQPCHSSIVLASSVDELHGYLVSASALLIMDSQLNPHVVKVIRRAPYLRWIQLCSSGYDQADSYGLAHDYILTHVPQVWAPIVAEHAVGLFLSLVRAIPHMVVAQQHHLWNRGEISGRLDVAIGKTALILGAGAIGGEIAKRLAAFGLSVIGVSNSGKARWCADAYDEVVSSAALDQVLPVADVVFVCIPLSRETQGFFGSEKFGAMRPGSYLINVSRGGTVDSDALAVALQAGILAGCAVDVTDPEPLDAESSLWDMPQMLVSPHVGGHGGDAGIRRLRAAVRDNVDRWLAGDELQHVIAVSSG